MRTGVLVVTVLVAPACVSLPEYQGPDRVQRVRIDDSVVFIDDEAELRFGGLSGFPSSLIRVNSPTEEMLGYATDPDPVRKLQDAAGIALLSQFAVNDSTVPDPAVSGFVTERAVLAEGPAMVQVEVRWSMSWPMSALPSNGNLSRFSIFPDGRIVRHDEVHGQPTGTVDLHFMTYWSFARATYSRSAHQWDTQLASDNALTETLVLPADDARTGWMCIQRDQPADRLIGMSWRVPTSPYRSVTLESGSYAPELVGMHLDWVIGGDTADMTYLADTALFVRPSGTCVEVMPELADEYQQVEPAFADATFRPADGVYEAAPGPHTTTRPVPSGFAFEIAAPAVDVELDGRAIIDGVHYASQATETGVLLWFGIPLATGVTLTFTPR